MPEPKRNPVGERLDRVLNAPPRGTPVINLAHEAMVEIDRLQRERDILLEAAKEAEEALSDAAIMSEMTDGGRGILDRLRAAIAECRGGEG